MPFKHHSKGRRHIPRQRHRVTNWRDYDTALRNRGSLTIWFTEEALVGWRAQSRKTPGGQPHYSNLAIETALTLRAVFRLALRQSEGLIGSIMELLEIDLPFPIIRRSAAGLVGCRFKTYTFWNRRTASDRRQHGTEVAWRGRMAIRKTRNLEAPILAQTSCRHRRRQWSDRRL